MAMLSSVLKSDRVVDVNVEIMRTFVRLRRFIQSHDDLARKLSSLEKKYEGQFKAVFEAIRQLMKPASHTQNTPPKIHNFPSLMTESLQFIRIPL